MRTIHHYPIPLSDSVAITTHTGAKFLDLDVRRGDLTAWFEVDTDAPEVVERFALVGTGTPVPAGHQHLATHHARDGYVWHLYRRDHDAVASLVETIIAEDSALLARLGMAVVGDASAYTNPDCVAGKHAACAGDAWDEAADGLVGCGCTCHRQEDGQ